MNAREKSVRIAAKNAKPVGLGSARAMSIRLVCKRNKRGQFKTCKRAK